MSDEEAKQQKATERYAIIKEAAENYFRIYPYPIYTAMKVPLGDCGFLAHITIKLIEPKKEGEDV